MIPFYCDIQGEAYRRLIDYIVERSKFFVLATRHSLGLSEKGERALTALMPFLIETRHMGEMMPDNAIAYSKIQMLPGSRESAERHGKQSV